MRRVEREECGETGFTLVELLVSLMLALLVAGAIASFNRFQLFTLVNQTVQLDVQSTARAITELVSREVRSAGLNAKPAFCGIAAAQSNTIRIQADYDGNGTLNGPNEDVTYRYDSTRKVIERVDQWSNRADVLVEGLQTVSFNLRYFDQNGTEISGTTGLSASQRAAVRRVRLSLILGEKAVDPQNPQIFHGRAATDIDLRNRFFAGAVNSQPCT
jgi:type II secretory pathway component PulJ